ncbi:LAQU0S07e04170g1_1 [Lachancea quebecensis]|uniref:LAQU0S07e04170g1_1 n=1 Tax=Lachancea quebecensis TaxID=1654605 RepID=A0A0P1KZN6_9SACH|nr:LAQU0S07e04170g1_1 [Lachancea quebecensis]
MADALNIPGFYFDPEKNRYFKITTQSLTQTDQKYGREKIKDDQEKSRHKHERAQTSELREKRLHEIEFRLLNPLARVFPEEVSKYSLSDGGTRFDCYQAMNNTYTLFIHGKETEDFEYVEKRGFWSDVTPVLGAVSQKAKFITLLPSSNAAVVVTSYLCVLLVELQGGARYIHKRDLVSGAESEIVRAHLTSDSLCIFGKPVNQTNAVFVTINLSNESPQLTRTFHYSGRKLEVFDAITNDFDQAFLAQSSVLTVSKIPNQETAIPHWHALYKSKSDIMSLEIDYTCSVSERAPARGWLGTRNGGVYQWTDRSGSKKSSTELIYSFRDLSVVSLKSIDGEYLLVSLVGKQAQFLYVLSKVQRHANRRHPAVLSLRTTFKNFSKDTEIIEISSNGRFILYGHAGEISSGGGFEVFSTLATDNFASEKDSDTATPVYFPLRTMRECFPPSALDSVRSLLRVELHDVQRGSYCFGKKSSRDGLTVSLLTEDFDTAGISLRNSRLL